MQRNQLFMSGIIGLNNKSCEKDIRKELMPVAWHLTRWWDYIDGPIFCDKSEYKACRKQNVVGSGNELTKLQQSSRKVA